MRYTKNTRISTMVLRHCAAGQTLREGENCSEKGPGGEAAGKAIGQVQKVPVKCTDHIKITQRGNK